MNNSLESSTNNIRISDIAKKAKVSVGTVDRVIHNRGRVSEKTRELILKAIEELNYKPNIMAQALAMKKERVLYAFIPYFQPGEYWEIVDIGIRKAQEELKVFGFVIKKAFFDQYRVESFIEKAEELKKNGGFDGIIIAPHFAEEVCQFTTWLTQQEIPYIFIDSDIEHDNQLAYFGVNSHDCGKVFAKLILEITPSESDILILDIHKKRNRKSTQVTLLEIGFNSHISDIGQIDRIKRMEICMGEAGYEKELDDFFANNQQVKGVVIFNSRAYYLAEYLEKKNKDQIKIVGFDLLAKNVEFLKKGQIAYLISQEPEIQGYQALRALSNYIMFKSPINKINHTPIDIIIKENVDYYWS